MEAKKGSLLKKSENKVSREEAAKIVKLSETRAEN
jgi:hypothetical protein